MQALEAKLIERLALDEKESEYKVMTAGMINLLDERVNGQETRVQQLEKLTKEVHAAV